MTRVRVEFLRRVLRFREPIATAFGVLTQREVVELALTGADGVTGRGEAGPLPAYDGISVDRAAAALEAYRPVLLRSDDLSGAEILDACRDLDDLPHALAAVDVALWDRAGRRESAPIAALLAGAPATVVPVNATIGAQDRAGAASAAAAAARAGYACVKLKVGVGDDAGRVAAGRAAAGPAMALRLDANGAWDVGEAITTLEALAPAGLELVEEPVHGLEALRAVRDAVEVRVAMDETAAEPGALASGAADAVCLKLGRCGGISGLLAAAELVRATGSEPYVASAFDGPIGIAAAVHAVAALSSRAPMPPCGLATLGLFEGADPLPARDGVIAVPTGPGLGI